MATSMTRFLEENGFQYVDISSEAMPSAGYSMRTIAGGEFVVVVGALELTEGVELVRPLWEFKKGDKFYIALLRSWEAGGKLATTAEEFIEQDCFASARRLEMNFNDNWPLFEQFIVSFIPAVEWWYENGYARLAVSQED